MIVARRASLLIQTLRNHSLAHCKSGSWQLLTPQQGLFQGDYSLLFNPFVPTISLFQVPDGGKHHANFETKVEAGN